MNRNSEGFSFVENDGNEEPGIESAHRAHPDIPPAELPEVDLERDQVVCIVEVTDQDRDPVTVTRALENTDINLPDNLPSGTIPDVGAALAIQMIMKECHLERTSELWNIQY